MRCMTLIIALLGALPVLSQAEETDAVEKATNPLHLSTAIALQDYYTP